MFPVIVRIVRNVAFIFKILAIEFRTYLILANKK